MRVESVPVLVKNIDHEVASLRKKESSYEYRKAAEFRELDANKDIQSGRLHVVEVKETERVISPFISSTLIGDIEDVLFSSSTVSSSFPSSQSSTSTSSSTSSPYTTPYTTKNLSPSAPHSPHSSSTPSSPSSSSASTTVDSTADKRELSEIETDTDVTIDSTPYLANTSPEMAELLVKRSHLHNEWQGVRAKLANINKMRHAIEALKVSLKSATKLGNHSKIDSIEQFEIPEKESIMTNILSSISPDSPFYYLCDTVTSTEIANIMAKNTGIPMGNLLEGRSCPVLSCPVLFYYSVLFSHFTQQTNCLIYL
jgi:ATP-dependent Clp protease ATP-binding subunit ClpA